MTDYIEPPSVILLFVHSSWFCSCYKSKLKCSIYTLDSIMEMLRFIILVINYSQLVITYVSSLTENLWLLLLYHHVTSFLCSFINSFSNIIDENLAIRRWASTYCLQLGAISMKPSTSTMKGTPSFFRLEYQSAAASWSLFKRTCGRA